ncbi:hypothetical protein ElyMa_000229800 [Elysia marginata]|uniref:Ig-like domain-containing protein n=1 Tax=Elysia marginata TaxID=1093978 RepID=A0AAV4F239_9GAST|nr:hypothetical protein ElyMa_000229800 [Elysia marginata]
MALGISVISFFLLCFIVVEGREIPRLNQPRDTTKAANDDLPGSSNPIDVLSVERVTSADSSQNTFTLRFTKNIQDLRLEVYDFHQPLPQRGTEGQEAGGVTTFTFTLNITAHYHAVIQASAQDRSASQMLVVQNYAGDPVRQDAIHTVDFDVLPRGQIVYTPGENAQFKVLLTAYTGRVREWSDYPDVDFHVLDITDQLFRNIYDFDSIAEKTQRVTPDGYNETTVIVKTAEKPVTGMFDVRYAAEGEEGDLVTEYIVTKSRVLKPSVLADIFPPGYVGFIQKEPQQCRIGQECISSCVAVGNSVSDIRVEEIGEAMMNPVPSARQIADHFPYTRHLIWEADATDASFAGQTKRFRCQAKDANYDHWASLEIDISYVQDAVIDEERSNVTLETEGNMTKATLTCAVHGGYPTPNMTFNLEYEYAHYYGSSPDEIITQAENEFLMLKVVTFDPEEGHGGYYHTPTGKLVSATCETYQSGMFSYSTYSLPFHDFTVRDD